MAAAPRASRGGRRTSQTAIAMPAATRSATAAAGLARAIRWPGKVVAAVLWARPRPGQLPDREGERQCGDGGEADAGVGPPVGTEGRAGQAEDCHTRLVRQVCEQAVAGREGGDGVVGEVRGTGVQQPLSPVLDGDDLLLRLAPYRFDDERYESGGDPGGQRERGPAGDVGAPGGQLADDDEGGRGVAGGGDPAPRMVRRQRGGEGG